MSLPNEDEDLEDEQESAVYFWLIPLGLVFLVGGVGFLGYRAGMFVWDLF